MSARVLKIIAFIIGAPIALLFAGVCFFLVTDRIAYEEASITDQLLRDGVYDPARYFSYDRACTFPPEVFGISDVAPGYNKMDGGPLLPDTFTHWTLVLIDDAKKTYRTLYVVDLDVRFGGRRCLPKIILRTKMSNGHLTAYAEEAKVQ